jgi:uncharacterized membrane protein
MENLLCGVIMEDEASFSFWRYAPVYVLVLCGVIMEGEASFSFWRYAPVYVLVLQKNHRILSIRLHLFFLVVCVKLRVRQDKCTN